MTVNRFLVMVFIGTLVFVGCKKDKSIVTPVCDGSNTTYTNFVANYISSNCASCHDYSTYAKLSTILSNGQFKSQVLSNQTMPKGNTSSSSDLNKLQCWVENNYPEN